MLGTSSGRQTARKVFFRESHSAERHPLKYRHRSGNSGRQRSNHELVRPRNVRSLRVMRLTER